MSEDKLPTPAEQALMFQDQLDQRIMEALNRKLDNMDELAMVVSQKMAVCGMRNKFVFDLVSDAYAKGLIDEGKGKSHKQVGGQS